MCTFEKLLLYGVVFSFFFLDIYFPQVRCTCGQLILCFSLFYKQLLKLNPILRCVPEVSAQMRRRRRGSCGFVSFRAACFCPCGVDPAFDFDPPFSFAAGCSAGLPLHARANRFSSPVHRACAKPTTNLG